ncbi:hypothetical protein BC937DRAFT_89260 [Endogone sp. FLAS-F59071]|nr:hypothetical protein BC937DRAFT_89260 [Endogone sp. FLAS-F59071]|eukprot:RUS17990.1 hypothetical protein BC937DRAFT_89260 [Endogone sp. FLAS-F59071]
MLKQPINGEAHTDPPSWPARVRDLAVRINNLDLSDLASLTAPITVEALLDTLTALYDDCRIWCEAGGSERLSGNVGTFNKRYGDVIEKIKLLRLNKDDFETIKPLAKGQFGTVSIVRSKIDGIVYAMKTLDKQNLLKQREQAFFMEERNVLSSPHRSHWMPALHAAFQDSEHLYLVMEYAAGGDLYSIQDRREGLVLEEQAAKFYIAETVLAVQTLHEMQYVHRDIKPQNILISHTGHIKLADFGSCIRLNAKHTVTSPIPVGTCDYISPEVLRAGEGDVSYGVEVDWWSVGILLYELLQGEPPFCADSLAETYAKIMDAEQHLQFNPEIPISEEAKDLIKKFLCPKEQRLGRNGIKEIKEHSFFRGIDWGMIDQSTPPFLPIIRSPDDTSNFSSHDEEDGAPVFNSRRLSGSVRRDFEGDNLPFIGYTFLRNVTEAAGARPEPPASPTPTSSRLTTQLDDALRRLADRDRQVAQLGRDKARLQSDLDFLRKTSSASTTSPSPSPAPGSVGGGVARRALEFADMGVKQQLADAQRRIDELERDRRRAQQELDAVKKFRSAAEDDAERRKLRAELEGERWEREMLERRYSELLGEVEVERGRREHLERVVVETRGGAGKDRSVGWLQRELERVKGELKVAEERVEEERTLRNEGKSGVVGEEVERERKEMMKRVEEMVARREEAERRVEELEKIVADSATGKKNDDDATRTQLKEDIAQTKADLEKLQSQLDASSDRQRDLESQLATVTAQLRTETSLRQTSDSRAYDLLAKLTQLQAATAEAEATRQRGDRRASEQLQPFKSQIDELSGQLSLERLENAQLRIEAEHARKEAERRKEETEEIKEKCERLQRQIGEAAVVAAAAETAATSVNLDAAEGSNGAAGFDRTISLSMFKREKFGTKRLQQQLEGTERKWMLAEREVEKLKNQGSLSRGGTMRGGEADWTGQDGGSIAAMQDGGRANRLSAVFRLPAETGGLGDEELEGTLRVSWVTPSRSVKQNFRTMFVKVIDFRVMVFESNAAAVSTVGTQVVDLRADVFAVRTVTKNELVHLHTRDLECMFQVRSSNLNDLKRSTSKSSIGLNSQSIAHLHRIRDLERDIEHEEEIRVAAAKMMEQWRGQKQNQDHYDVARQQFETSAERVRALEAEVEALKNTEAEVRRELLLINKF